VLLFGYYISINNGVVVVSFVVQLLVFFELVLMSVFVSKLGLSRVGGTGMFNPSLMCLVVVFIGGIVDI